jgi:hypothetical protein
MAGGALFLRVAASPKPILNARDRAGGVISVGCLRCGLAGLMACAYLIW